jgi:hypothetical protein
VFAVECFLSDVRASYSAWQRMADFEDMTKPFGLAREESTRKCFAEKNCITTHGDFLGSVAQSLLERPRL